MTSLLIDVEASYFVVPLQVLGVLDPTYQRFGIEIIDEATKFIRLTLPETPLVHDDIPCPGSLWSVLSVLLQTVRDKGHVTDDILIMVAPTAHNVAVASRAIGLAWLEEAAAGGHVSPTSPAHPQPSVTVTTTPVPSGPGGTSTVTVPATARFVDSGSVALESVFTLVPNVTLDVISILYDGVHPKKGRVALRVVMITTRSDGSVWLRDFLGERIVTAADDCELLTELITRAAPLATRSDGVVVDVATRAVYTGRASDLRAAVVRQFIETEATFLGAVTSHMHPRVGGMVAYLAGQARHPHPAHKVFCAIGFCLSMVLAIGFTYAHVRTGIAPWAWMLVQLPWFRDDPFATQPLMVHIPEFVPVLGGGLIVVTFIKILAWLPSIGELVFGYFSRASFFGRMFVYTLLIDAGVIWAVAFLTWPDHLAILSGSPLIAFVVELGWFVGSGLIAVVSVSIFELLAAICLLCTVALAPAFFWLLGVVLSGLTGGTLELLGLVFIRSLRRVGSIGTRWTDEWADGQVHVVGTAEPTGAPTPVSGQVVEQTVAVDFHK